MTDQRLLSRGKAMDKNVDYEQLGREHLAQMSVDATKKGLLDARTRDDRIARLDVSKDQFGNIRKPNSVRAGNSK